MDSNSQEFVNVDKGIDDVQHFISQCPRHQEVHSDLEKAVIDVWTVSRNEGNLIISVPLLLVPDTDSRLSRPDCLDILTALFEFITR